MPSSRLSYDLPLIQIPLVYESCSDDDDDSTDGGYSSHRSFASSNYGNASSMSPTSASTTSNSGLPPQQQRRSLRMSMTVRKPASDILKCSSCPCPDFCPNPFSPNFCRDCYHSDSAHSNKPPGAANPSDISGRSSSNSTSSSKRGPLPPTPSSPPHRGSHHSARSTVAINSILATYITNTADQAVVDVMPRSVAARSTAFSVSSASSSSSASALSGAGKFSPKSTSSKVASNGDAAGGGGRVTFGSVSGGRDSNATSDASNTSTESYFDRYFRFQRAKSIVLGGGVASASGADGDAAASSPMQRRMSKEKRDSVIPGKCADCKFISKRTNKFCSNCGVPLAPVPSTLPSLKETSTQLEQPPLPPPKNVARSSYPQKKRPHPPPVSSKPRSSAPSVASPKAARSPRSLFSRAPATNSPDYNASSSSSSQHQQQNGSPSMPSMSSLPSSLSSGSLHWPANTYSALAYSSLSSSHLANPSSPSSPSKSAPSSSSNKNSPRNLNNYKYATISSGMARGSADKSNNSSSSSGESRSIFKTMFGRGSSKKKSASSKALVSSSSTFNLKSTSAASTPRSASSRFGTFSPLRGNVKRNNSDQRYRGISSADSPPETRPHSFSDPEVLSMVATTSSQGSNATSSPSLRPRSALSKRISNNVFVSMDRASNASDKDQPSDMRRKNSSPGTSPRLRPSHHQPHSQSSGIPTSPATSPRATHQPHSQSDMTLTMEALEKPLQIGLPTPVLPSSNEKKRPAVPTASHGLRNGAGGGALSPTTANGVGGDLPRTPRRRPPHPPKMPRPTRPGGFSLASNSSSQSPLAPLSTNASSNSYASANSSNASSSSSSSSNASSFHDARGGGGGLDGRVSPRHDLHSSSSTAGGANSRRWSFGDDQAISRPPSSQKRFLDLQAMDNPTQIMETPEVNELEQRRGIILQELDQYSGAEISDQETWDYVTNLRAELDQIEDRLSPWGDPEDPLLDELFEAFINGSIDPAEIVERAPTESLSIHFLMICNSLLETPMYLEYYKKRVLSVMAMRVGEDPYLKQQVTFTRAAGTPDVINLLSGFDDNATALPVFLKFFQEKRNKGYEIEIQASSVVYHPFKPMRLRKIRVEKVFNSNSRPLLLKLYGQSRPELVLFKNGDDLRQDMACMAIFRLLNQIWESEQHINHSCALEARVYDCLALSPNFGAIEYLPNCMSLFELGERKPKFDAAQQARLVATGAGSYMASWLLGIKDRHDDNTLIAEDGTIFHIDFGYILGEKVSVDTADFAITKELKNTFGQHGWVSFTSNCVKAYVLLRKHHQTIIRFAAMMLGPLYTHDRVVEYLSKSLLLDMSLSDAILHINTLIKKAPNSYRTRIKNALHHRAQQYKERKFEEANREAEMHDWSDVVKSPVA